jgi:hypothetical protein
MSHMQTAVTNNEQPVASYPKSENRPETKTPIELRQSKVRLRCGTLTLRIDMCLANKTHAYVISVYPGFVGGGRAEDLTAEPRIPAVEFAPKMFNSATGEREGVWPPIAAVERRVDGFIYNNPGLPEGTLPHRLETAFCKVEPLLRQLVNQRQDHMALGRAGQVADQPLIARIKSILTNY